MQTDITETHAISTAMGTMIITAQDAAAVIDTIRSAKARNTIRAHASRLAAFRSWLLSRGMQLIDGVAVPAPVVVTYLCARWDAGRKLNTVDADLAAIGYWHGEQGLDSPSRDKAVRDCMAGLRRKTSAAIQQGVTAMKPVCADAVVSDQVRRIIRTIDTQAVNESVRLRDRAMLLMGFAMGARRSELAALRADHIQWHRQGIVAEVWNGKTGDRLSEISLGDNPSMCAVTALRQWMQHANITEGPLFRQITVTPRGDRRAVISQQGIAGQVVNRTFAKWAQAADLPLGRWTAHSMRAGFIVQGTIDGKPESELRAQTGHKSGVYYGYAQRAEAFTIRRNASL